MSRELYDHETEVIANLQKMGYTIIPPGKPLRLYTARDVATKLNLSIERIYTLARSRKAGTKLGPKHIIFTEGDVARMKPWPTGRPRKGTIR